MTHRASCGELADRDCASFAVVDVPTASSGSDDGNCDGSVPSSSSSSSGSSRSRGSGSRSGARSDASSRSTLVASATDSTCALQLNARLAKVADAHHAHAQNRRQHELHAYHGYNTRLSAAAAPRHADKRAQERPSQFWLFVAGFLVFPLWFVGAMTRPQTAEGFRWRKANRRATSAVVVLAIVGVVAWAVATSVGRYQ